MARGRAASHTLAVLLCLLFLICVTAVPTSNAIPAQLPGQNGSTTPAKGMGGGWNVATIIGMTAGIVVTILVMLSLASTVHHRRASLRIHKQLLERISHIAEHNPSILASQPPETGAGVGTAAGTGRPQAPWRTTSGMAADAYHLAVLMSSAAHLSPTVYSAIQEQIQPTRPSQSVPPVETKTRAPIMEDKVLGRREDMVSLGGRSRQAADADGVSSAARLAP